jgi:hypothetical protein
MITKNLSQARQLNPFLIPTYAVVFLSLAVGGAVFHVGLQSVLIVVAVSFGWAQLCGV